MSLFSLYARSFLDELEKIAAAPQKETRHGWSISKNRNGRKPMSVGTLLKKEKDGSLGGYKLAQFSSNSLPFTDVTDKGSAQTLARKMPGYIPSRDELNVQNTKREDGRDFAQTIMGPSTIIGDIGIAGRPSERTGE